MSIVSLETLVDQNEHHLMMVYGTPGAGKTTFLGLVAEKSEGKTLVLDIDRTVVTTLGKKEIVKDLSKITIRQVNISQSVLDSKKKVISSGTWDDWNKCLQELAYLKKEGKLNVDNICVDNISELERCLLSDLGAQGNNDGTPCQGDYQKVYFNIVNTLRFLKSLGKNTYVTAWEMTDSYTNTDGSVYTRSFPKISPKIVDNVCGVCDIVAKLHIDNAGARHLVMDSTKNIYAKNQIDSRKLVKVEEF